MLAIVLSRRDFREADQVVSVYTHEKGKLELLARGVKKITSKNTAHLEPFSVIDIGTAPGKELNVLTSVQGVEYFSAIRQDLHKSMAAQYVVELTDRLVHEGEVDVKLFGLLKSWLGYIDMSQKLWIDAYIVALLHCLGFTLSQDPRIRDSQWLGLIEICEHGEWERLDTSDIDTTRFHQIVLKLAQYYTERKIVDHAKTCII